MHEQFFGRTFWQILGALAAVFVISSGLYVWPAFSPWVLFLIGAAVFVLSLRRLDLGLLVAFAELFANSHGHLIFAELFGWQVGLRMAIFVGVLAAWFILFLLGRAKITWSDQRLLIFVPLLVAAAVGFVVGAIGHPLADVFQDGNSYFYLAYLLPVLSVEWNSVRRRRLLQALAAAALWVSILTLLLLYVFSHFLDWDLTGLYKFIRDTRTGELTLMGQGIFRVFIQAQITTVFFVFFSLPFMCRRGLSARARWHMALLLALPLSAILVSLSRSFWVGLVCGAVVYLVLWFCLFRPGWRLSLSSLGFLAAAKIIAFWLIIFAIFVPLPYRSGSFASFSSLFASRATGLSDSAIDSRWKLLDPMLVAIKDEPWFGHGFGQKVEFITDDPRLRAQIPDGRWQTYSMEWGWLEIWLKLGLFGLLGFGVAFFGLLRGLRPYFSGPAAWLGLSAAASLAFLAATHVFSPYLNHPLGLGFLLFLVPFLNKKTEPVGSGASVLIEKLSVAPVQPRVAPLTSKWPAKN